MTTAKFLLGSSLKGVLALLGLLATALVTVAAHAEGSDSQSFAWAQPSQNPDSPGYKPHVDRSFVREWEANPPRGYPTLSPANVANTEAAIRRYTEIVAKGGWGQVPDVQLEPGVTHAAVAAVRSHLKISGDIKEDSSFPNFCDGTLQKAVMRFQASNGLTPTGIVDKRTIAALNIPADVRLKQLKVNIARLKELSHGTAKGKYVIVNIPAAQVEAVDNNVVISRHAGVVGKVDRPSPLLNTAITDLHFNPVWTLPPTVIQKDLIPKGRDMQAHGGNVLAKFGIDAYDGNGKKLDATKINWSSATAQNLTYRQQPSKDNPLGYVKINFDNAYSVYMHSTPSESLFGRNFRAASSGCVRVERIDQLVAWLLEGNSSVSPDRAKDLKASGETITANLKHPVPLHWVYITAWATDDGVVQFRRDLYNKDGVGALAASY